MDPVRKPVHREEVRILHVNSVRSLSAEDTGEDRELQGGCAAEGTILTTLQPGPDAAEMENMSAAQRHRSCVRTTSSARQIFEADSAHISPLSSVLHIEK